jgi:acetylornithine deacetylase/succinyl-diaminopimelate desuccinylase-like protein
MAFAMAMAGGAAAQPQSAADVMKDPAVKAALDAAKASEEQTIDDQIRFCEIPAPSFKETARGEELKKVFQQLGLQNVRVDKAGNVLGDRPGGLPRPRLVMAAHLDTVFPEGTDVKVRREGAVLHGPGIGDDCRGLAVLVAIIRTMTQANVRTPGSITFVANVGEEGLGDLRGMKQLFNDTLKGTVDKFVSIDGTGLSLTHTFVGSHRYRVTFTGPGGHSFGAFGLANPVNALGRAIAKIADFQVPKEPKTTFNVGRISGGTSVNSIPFDAWMEVDMRSVDKAALASVDANFHKAVDAALLEENARWGTPGVLTVKKDLVGDRPAGSMPADSPIVKTAIDATRAFGWTPTFGAGSSDANYPASLGIPSLDIGGGGRGTEAHALGEAFDTTNSWQGTQRALLLTIALAQK